MTEPTTVTYFRTGLDKFDGYRLADIFSGDSADTSTPAAVLATHLHEMNAAVRWFVDPDLVIELGMGSGMPMYLDAATFEHAGSSHVVAEIKTIGIGDATSDRRFTITQGTPRGNILYALATSSGFERPYHARGTTRVKEDELYRDEQVAEHLATRTTSFKGNISYLHFYNSVNGRGAVQLEPPHLDGFEPVSWDSQRWHNRYTEILGTHAVGDIASEDNTPIMSSIAQGEGYTPLVELREIN